MLRLLSSKVAQIPRAAEIHKNLRSTVCAIYFRVDDDKEGEKSSPGVLERAVVEKARELESQIAAAPIPHGANDDLYGIPMLDIGSESEVRYLISLPFLHLHSL